jgi:hypothetical protein
LYNILSDSLLFKTTKYCINDVNKILNYFIKKFNKSYPKNINTPFYIYKFRIHNIKQKKINNKNCITNYQFIVVLLEKEGYLGITLFIDMIIYKNNIYIKNGELIGYYTTDKLFLPRGLKEIGEDNYYELNPLYRIDKSKKTLVDTLTNKNWPYLNINYSNVWPLLWKTKQYKLDNTLKYQFTCFNKEPQFYKPNYDNDFQPILFHVYNKTNCESKYDHFGRRKPQGLWDRPCLNDNECLFYGANKNYPNHFGKCNKEYGFCQLPKGLKHLGFHYHNKNSKPLCYNCNSVNKENIWKPITNLDTCCEKQKNRKLYPHLNSPDYAFHDDFNERINHFI